ncbi:MAG: DNA-protecting protein DprA [Candidatus Aenigmarchaeota archaeon]|nr:DNA-protecting protein DprA [Candidatus Aenigmarchaeota archaeon]
MEDEIKYWIAFGKNLKMGPVKFKKLYGYFSSMEKAWEAKDSELVKLGLESDLVAEISAMKKKINPDKELERLNKAGIQTISILDKKYPEKLKETYNPPALLYTKGNFTILNNEYLIAIVGTRKPTDYGRQITYEIANNLAKNEITIVSGMALGIDTQAHKGTLDSKGETIAVLGCGLDKPYPTSNSDLAKEIARNGCLISEYPLGTAALKQNFPARNRIISGLSLGVLVTEAGEESGALITARYALEQNREVFAIPGSIYNKNSLGPNNLIKLGAKLVTKASDILEELNLESAAENIKAKKIYPDTKEEAIILDILKDEPTHIDLIVEQSGLDAALVNSTLTMMEIKGKVKNIGQMNYIISR